MALSIAMITPPLFFQAGIKLAEEIQNIQFVLFLTSAFKSLSPTLQSPQLAGLFRIEDLTIRIQRFLEQRLKTINRTHIGFEMIPVHFSNKGVP